MAQSKQLALRTGGNGSHKPHGSRARARQRAFLKALRRNPNITAAALVVDIREGDQLKKLPVIIRSIKKQLHTTVLFLEADDDVLLRRFSETRRPHPLGKEATVKMALEIDARACGVLLLPQKEDKEP